MNFYAERNKSKTYSVKLYKKINKEMKVLVKHPLLGLQTEIKGVRGLIVDDYVIFYEIGYERIIVHAIWDSRQNPEILKLH